LPFLGPAYVLATVHHRGVSRVEGVRQVATGAHPTTITHTILYEHWLVLFTSCLQEESSRKLRLKDGAGAIVAPVLLPGDNGQPTIVEEVNDAG
jgi:hypothetical protein